MMKHYMVFLAVEMGCPNPGFYFIPTKWLAELRQWEMDRVQKTCQCSWGCLALSHHMEGRAQHLDPKRGSIHRKWGSRYQTLSFGSFPETPVENEEEGVQEDSLIRNPSLSPLHSELWISQSCSTHPIPQLSSLLTCFSL